MCELRHTSLVVQKMQGALSFSSDRFLIGELRLGKLSETIVVHGNASHNRPRFLVSHLIGNRPSFLCTKAPMLRIPDELSGWHSQDLLKAKPFLGRHRSMHDWARTWGRWLQPTKADGKSPDEGSRLTDRTQVKLRYGH